MRFKEMILQDIFMEQWKEIENYPNYWVSSNGRIKSTKFGKELIMKSRLHNGYQIVTLQINTNRIYIHRVVAKAFIPNPNHLSVVMHIDKDRLNNSVANLRWASRAQTYLNRSFNRFKNLRIKTEQVISRKTYERIYFTNSIGDFTPLGDFA